MDDDFNILRESETPVSKAIFWTGTSIIGLPLLAFSVPIQKASQVDPDVIYAPGRNIGMAAGAVVGAPFYAVEKSCVTVKKNFQH